MAEGGVKPNISQQALVKNEIPDVKFISTPSGEVTPTRASSAASGGRRITAQQGISVAILCFINLINYMDRFTVAGILTEIQDHYGVNDSMAGLLQTVFIVSYMIFAPLFGFLGDRYNRKWIMALGVFIWSLTTLLGSFMETFTGFILMRAAVGIGEASYSTIAPTLISDMFAKDLRSIMLAVFYFAIPIGSGLGYIVGSGASSLAGQWQWGLRVTPILGAVAVILLIVVLVDPPRGESEGTSNLQPTTWSQDLKALVRNPSFVLGTLGFTCVAFVAGALSWWGPKYVTDGLKLQVGDENADINDVSFIFGVVTMLAGLVGVSLGSFSATRLRPRFPRADPVVCAAGLLLSMPFMFGGAIVCQYSTNWAYVLLFIGQVFLNLNWSIVADMLLYVVVPTRRSTAEAFQILASHLFGDAGSPYLIGIVSDALQRYFSSSSDPTSSAAAVQAAANTTLGLPPNATEASLVETVSLALAAPSSGNDDVDTYTQFKSMQYALFITMFVEVLGGVFFLINAAYIVRDRERARRLTAGGNPDAVADIPTNHVFADDPMFREQTRELLS
ncbi:protein spinster-like isoform X1 [Amphibalanus amphitrite]|uniref:protein spinster-like isoform X1 n=1 Tax=Amphibalanus amphitrite TaxID=1232801 RepID=UPI001C8FB55E|nr:protein spinster-like isoform X1 [Amphibalanus amphitrite]